jgi:hypothetical protein
MSSQSFAPQSLALQCRDGYVLSLDSASAQLCDREVTRWIKVCSLFVELPVHFNCQAGVCYYAFMASRILNLFCHGQNPLDSYFYILSTRLTHTVCFAPD